MKVETRAIARAFLDPARPFDRHHYYYARSKLATDPLYAGVLDALEGDREPLLDVGCGIGLLLHVLRAEGRDVAYRGIDLDARKIAQAQAALTRAGLRDAVFMLGDAATGLPAHAGSVAILDVFQFLPDAAARESLMADALARVAPGGRLVLRTGLADGSTRAGITRLVDWLSSRWGWMRSSPDRYPERAWLEARLQEAGFDARITSLSGRTPFNNWLVLATRQSAR